MLEQNEKKVNWYLLSSNINIFEIDYLLLSIERTKIISEELMKVVWHPNKVFRYCNLDDDDFDIEYNSNLF